MNTKNNRLVCTDERNLQIYQSLPAEDFKEFMMAYLTYKNGDDLTKLISNPLVRSLFMTYIEKIEYNETQWEKAAEARRNNGKKGGRKKKNGQDMQPNMEFDSEVENKPNKTVITAEYPNPQPKTESPSEGQESGKNEVLETVSSTNVDEVVKIGADAVGETEEDDNGIGGWDIVDTPSEQWFVFDDEVVEEYERKFKEKEDMIKQEVIDKFKDIRYNSPEYWRAMREVIDPLPSCDKDTAIREINQYFKSGENATF